MCSWKSRPSIRVILPQGKMLWACSHERSEAPVKITKMMVSKLSMATDLSLSHCHLSLVLTVSAFVALLLSLHLTFTVLHMMFINFLVPVKTVFKTLFPALIS